MDAEVRPSRRSKRCKHHLQKMHIQRFGTWAGRDPIEKPCEALESCDESQHRILLKLIERKDSGLLLTPQSGVPVPILL